MTDTDYSPAIRFGAWALIALGVLMAIGNLPGPDAVLNWLIDLVFWPIDGTDHMAEPATHLLTAIIGGVIFGWGVMVLGLAGEPTRRNPHLIRRIVISGYLAWFTLDGLGSIVAGAPLNLVGNAAFLALLLWPLRKTPAPAPAETPSETPAETPT